MKVALKDDLRFETETDGVVFNHYSFCEIIKHIMVKYGNVTYNVANEKLQKSFLVKPPKTFNRVVLMTHELEYHWAMLTLHGQAYWLKGIPSNYNSFEEEYLEWEEEIKVKYKLNEPYEYYKLTTDNKPIGAN